MTRVDDNIQVEVACSAYLKFELSVAPSATSADAPSV